MSERIIQDKFRWSFVIIPIVLVAVIFLGLVASSSLLFLLSALIAGVVLFYFPILGIFLLIIAALIIPIDIYTGTEVYLNPVTLLIPAMMGVALIRALRYRQLDLLTMRVNLPLFLFVVGGLVSLLIGYAIWDPIVPRGNSFLLVQFAQWAIFAFSAGGFWLTAELVREVIWLRRLTAVFLLIAGSLSLISVLPFYQNLISQITTVAFIRAPFWILLVGIAGGQLIFNYQLKGPVKIFLGLVIGSVIFYAFSQQREAASNWVGVGVVLITLIWLRWSRLRFVAILIITILIITGLFFPTIWNFAGGEAEWWNSGGSRLALITRVVEESMRNPITGLGPAAYRAYGGTRPLVYEYIVWFDPKINSHNNYVDIFSQTGLVGMAFFGWFAIEIGLLGHRLRKRYETGFPSGYVNGMLAVGVSALAIMLIADWILPFVYNIGYPGFQASILVWIFLGGLPALDRMFNGGEQHRQN